MNQFKVFYYPNAKCDDLTLAKSVLVFDELVFMDHPSLGFMNGGTVGHASEMRNLAHYLGHSFGYPVSVLQPKDGVVEGDLEKLIDVDLGNDKYRRTFYELVHNDPTFIVEMVPNGNYGSNMTADDYRRQVLGVPIESIPRSVKEINNLPQGISPEGIIATSMALDSYKFNFATYATIDTSSHLFGDSQGMDMLLKAKLSSNAADERPSAEGVSHELAFALLQKLVPDEAFRDKKWSDLLHFRAEMAKDREKFQEKILSLTIDLENLSGDDKDKRVDELLYKYILPEARGYQNKLADTWDDFFKESTNRVIAQGNDLAQIMVTILPYSLTGALLAATAKLGTALLPTLTTYLKDRDKLQRRNPYTYLMKFH